MSTSSLVRLELRWKHKRNSINPALHAVGQTLASLDEAGYIIGVGSSFANAASYVHADAKAGTISIHAWFIGPKAWSAALAESKSESEESVFAIDDFGLRTAEPEVIDRTKGLTKPGWSVRGSLRDKPRLMIQTDTTLMAPALISEDRRLIAAWDLGLSGETRRALHAWNVQARAISTLAPAFEDEGLYLKWAAKELRTKKSPLHQEAKRLAGLITKESGCKVLVGPLQDPLGGF